MRNLTVIILLGMLILAGCKPQEFPEQTISDPSFHFHGTINDEAIDLVPGTDNYYMFTWEDDFDETRFLTSEIAKSDCDDCGEILSFHFGLEEDQLLAESGEIEIVEADWTAEGTLILYAEGYPEGSTFSWSLFGGIEISDEPFIEIDGNDAPPLISLVVNAGMPCEDSILWPILTFDPCLENLCIQPFSFEWIDETTLEVFPSENYDDSGVYQWAIEGGIELDGVAPGDADSFFINFDQPLLFSSQISLTYTGGFCNSSIVRILYPFDAGCASTEIETDYIANIDAQGIIIDYEDENGNYYSTNLNCFAGLVEQPEDSFFEINHSEDFGTNEHGDEINRISISGKVELFLEENPLESITLEFEDALIAVPK